MFGLPVEILTAIISGSLTFYASIVSMKTKAAAEEHRMLLERVGAKRELVQDAREMQNKEARWTRRTLALSACFAILIWPSMAPMFGLHVVTGWTELVGGFWPFTEAKSRMVWHSVEGAIVITPLHTHTLSAIVGFYFGSSVAENARLR